MINKKRKPLDDALAHEFVYGSSLPEDKPANQDTQAQDEVQATEAENTTPKLTVIPTPTKSVKLNLMDQLQQSSKEPTIRLTADLPESMHRKLSVLAAKTGRKKVEIVRMLLDEALKDIDE